MILSKIDIAGLVVVGLLLVWQDAHSESDLIMHYGSKHFGSGAANENFNEKNYGVGVKHRLGRNFSVRGGVYDNSYNNGSVYLSGDWHTSNRWFNYGIQAGGVTGYRGTPQGARSVEAYLLPYIAVGTRFVTAEVGCIPPLGAANIGVITLSARVALW